MSDSNKIRVGNLELDRAAGTLTIYNESGGGAFAPISEVVDSLRAAGLLPARTRSATDCLDEDGMRAGKDWSRTASAERVNRLRRADQKSGGSGLVAGEPLAPHGWGDVLFMTITGQAFDAEEAEAFWEAALGDDAGRINDEDFARRFVAGAIGVDDE